ncbi:hypothetical protein APHAL10511_006923 [Amanita phalloides]|nr:hypothetical protein APHAL10511_006923 [Amanita phalloides]
MDVQLNPPVGTNYFKLYTHKVSTPGPDFVKLHVTFYVYVTNAKPQDKDFTSKGGKVRIVVVYDGQFFGATSKFQFGLNYDADVTGVVSFVDQLPITGSETKQGDNNLYTIDYLETMVMFNNGGNSGFNFPARYKKTYSLTKSVQTTWNGLRSAGFDLSGSVSNPTLSGLQVLEADSLGIASVVILWEIGTQGLQRENFKIDFSAKTMEHAVVG